MKLKHKDKIRIARKLRSKEEERLHISLFDTEGWRARKQAISNRVRGIKPPIVVPKPVFKKQKSIWQKIIDFIKKLFNGKKEK